MAADHEIGLTGQADLISNLPALAQQDILIRCFDDKIDNIYSARVLRVEDQRLRISLPRRLAGKGYLQSSRPVSIIFVLDRQLYTCSADYLADERHSRELVVKGVIKPTTRRSHLRHTMQINAVYVSISSFSLTRGQLSGMRWRKGRTLDLSAGGVLLQVPIQVPVDSYLLMNLEIPGFQGSFFVFGQVRWFGLGDTRQKLYLCGVKFLQSDDLARHFSKRALLDIPKMMLQFDKKMQKKLEAYLKTAAGHRKQGDENDDK